MKRHAFLLLLCHACSDRGGSTFPYMPTPDATVLDSGKTGSGGASNGTGGATAAGGSVNLDGGRDASLDAKTACVAPAVDKCPSSKPSYKNDITPIFEAKCNSCHDGADANGPWPLTNLDDIVHWKALVVQDIQTCAMPPAGEGTPLTPAENEKILGWLACDAPNN
jgi:hypothetical protein